MASPEPLPDVIITQAYNSPFGPEGEDDKRAEQSDYAEPEPPAIPMPATKVDLAMENTVEHVFPSVHYGNIIAHVSNSLLPSDAPFEAEGTSELVTLTEPFTSDIEPDNIEEVLEHAGALSARL